MMASHVTRGSKTGQFTAVLVGAVLWICVAGAVMGGILGVSANALWPYPVLGLLTHGLALLVRRNGVVYQMMGSSNG